MTDADRYLRGIGISLLVHGALAAIAVWLWNRAPDENQPEPIRWDVSLIEPENAPPLPDRTELPLQQPDVAAEPPPPDPIAQSEEPLPASGNFGTTPSFDIAKLAVPISAGSVPILATWGGMAGTIAGLSGPDDGSGRRQMAVPGLAGALTPTVRTPPVYPLEARRKKIEGWVRVEMTVLEDGTVTDIQVKAAEPRGVFDQAALAAVAKWKFKPATEQGRTTKRRAGQTLRFELEG